MIYILTSQTEIKFSNIWNGHLHVICQALNNNVCRINMDEVNIENEFTKNDVIINIGTHTFLGGKILNHFAKEISKVRKTIFFMDDYDFDYYPPIQFRKAIINSSNLLLTNIKSKVTSKSLKMFFPIYINLNRAAFNLLPLVKPKYPKSFIYWGTYRQGREHLFYKYFRPEIYKTYLSTNIKNDDKFTDMYINYIPLDRVKVPTELQNYGFTVYMKDTKQPLMCPANRFYEAISAGLPIFFDKNCISDFDYIPDEFIINNATEIPLNKLENIQKIQRDLWCKTDYKQELINELTNLFNKYKIN